MTRKYLPFTIAKNMKYDYVKHCTADFETCTTEDGTDVRVWAWGLSDIMQYTAMKLAEEVQNVKFIYSQSDEISILLTDWDNPNTDTWYGYRGGSYCYRP